MGEQTSPEPEGRTWPVCASAHGAVVRHALLAASWSLLTFWKESPLFHPVTDAQRTCEVQTRLSRCPHPSSLSTLLPWEL